MSEVLVAIGEMFLFIGKAVLTVLCLPMFLIGILWPPRAAMFLGCCSDNYSRELRCGSLEEYWMTSLIMFFSTLADLLTIPICFVALGSWRTFYFCHLASSGRGGWIEFGTHFAAWYSFGQLLLDIPCSFVFIACLFPFWRLGDLCERLGKEKVFPLCPCGASSSSAITSTNHRGAALDHLLETRFFHKAFNAFVNLLCGIAALPGIITVYRACPYFNDCKKKMDEKENELKTMWTAKTLNNITSQEEFDEHVSDERRNIWRLESLKSFVYWLRDVVCFALLLPACASLYRGFLFFSTLWRRTSPWASLDDPAITITEMYFEAPPNNRANGVVWRIKGTKKPTFTLPENTPVNLYVRSEGSEDPFWNEVGNQLGGATKTFGQMLLPVRLDGEYFNPQDQIKSGETDLELVLDFDVAHSLEDLRKLSVRFFSQAEAYVQVEYGSHDGTLFHCGINIHAIDDRLARKARMLPDNAGFQKLATPERVSGERFVDCFWEIAFMQFLLLMRDILTVIGLILLHLFPQRCYKVYTTMCQGKARRVAQENIDKITEALELVNHFTDGVDEYVVSVDTYIRHFLSDMGRAYHDNYYFTSSSGGNRDAFEKFGQTRSEYLVELRQIQNQLGETCQSRKEARAAVGDLVNSSHDMAEALIALYHDRHAGTVDGVVSTATNNNNNNNNNDDDNNSYNNVFGGGGYNNNIQVPSTKRVRLPPVWIPAYEPNPSDQNSSLNKAMASATTTVTATSAAAAAAGGDGDNNNNNNNEGENIDLEGNEGENNNNNNSNNNNNNNIAVLGEEQKQEKFEAPSNLKRGVPTSLTSNSKNLFRQCGEKSAEQLMHQTAVRVQQQCELSLEAALQTADKEYDASACCDGSDAWDGVVDVVAHEVAQVLYDLAAVFCFLIVCCTIYRLPWMIQKVWNSYYKRQACVEGLREVAWDILYFLIFIFDLVTVRGTIKVIADLASYWPRYGFSFKIARAIITYHASLVVGDLCWLASLFFSCRAVMFAVATTLFGVLSPGVMLESAWLGSADKTKDSDSYSYGSGRHEPTTNGCLIFLLLLIASGWMWGTSFGAASVGLVLNTNTSFRSSVACTNSSSSSHRNSACDEYTGEYTGKPAAVYFGVMAGVVFVSMVIMMKRFHPNVWTLRRAVVRYARPTVQNTLAFIFLAIEALQLMCLSFSAAQSAGVIRDETVRQVFQYVFLLFGDTWTSDSLAFGAYFAIALMALQFFLVSMPIVCNYILGWHEVDVRKDPAFIAAMSIFGYVAQLTVARNLGELLSCQDGRSTYVFVGGAQPSTPAEGKCWEGNHRALAITAMVLGVFYLPATLSRNAFFDESLYSQVDVVFTQAYRMLTGSATVTATVVVALLPYNGLAALAVILGASIWCFFVSLLYRTVASNSDAKDEDEMEEFVTYPALKYGRIAVYAGSIMTSIFCLAQANPKNQADPSALWPVYASVGVMFGFYLLSIIIFLVVQRMHRAEDDSIDSVRDQMTALEAELHESDRMNLMWRHRRDDWISNVRSSRRVSELAILVSKIEENISLLQLSKLFMRQRPMWLRDLSRLIDSIDAEDDIDNVISKITRRNSRFCFGDFELDCCCCCDRGSRYRRFDIEEGDAKPLDREWEKKKVRLLEQCVQSVSNAAANQGPVATEWVAPNFDEEEREEREKEKARRNAIAEARKKREERIAAGGGGGGKKKHNEEEEEGGGEDHNLHLHHHNTSAAVDMTARADVSLPAFNPLQQGSNNNQHEHTTMDVSPSEYDKQLADAQLAHDIAIAEQLSLQEQKSQQTQRQSRRSSHQSRTPTPTSGGAGGGGGNSRHQGGGHRLGGGTQEGSEEGESEMKQISRQNTPSSSAEVNIPGRPVPSSED